MKAKLEVLRQLRAARALVATQPGMQVSHQITVIEHMRLEAQARRPAGNWERRLRS